MALLGSSNQEAQLQPSLMAYNDAEAELGEWFASLNSLHPLAAAEALSVQEILM